MNTENKNKFEVNLIAIGIELGFFRIPSKFKKVFPSKSGKVKFYLQNSNTPTELTYNPKHQRVYGLVKFYKKHNAEPKDKLEIYPLENNKFRILFKKLNASEKETSLLTQEEAEEVVDLSNLSSQTKGDIVEDRIKELILLYGQGMLNVYKSSNDTEGIDLIVVKKGIYQPIFIQVKSNFKLHNNKNLLVQVSESALTPHHTFFIVGAYFNPVDLELHDKIAFIPSSDFKKLGNVVSIKKGKAIRATIPIKEGSEAKFAKYFINKMDFVNKILDKFEEIERYYK